MRKIIVVIITIISILSIGQAQEEEVIFEKIGYAPDSLLGGYTRYVDSRIIRRPQGKDKNICLRSNDTLYILNLNTLRERLILISELDSLILGGRIIIDSPLVGIFTRNNSNDLFIMEKENRMLKLELPMRYIGFWYDYNDEDSTITIIGGNKELIRYVIDLSRLQIRILDTICVKTGGYNFIFGGEVDEREEVLLFTYPYVNKSVAVILRKINNEIKVEERDDNALGLALIGEKKYSMLGDQYPINTVIFDIFDRSYKKYVEGEYMMITGADLLLETRWGYEKKRILNINGEVVGYVHYQNQYWTTRDAVRIDPTTIIIVGEYKPNPTSSTRGSVVIKKKLSFFNHS